MPEYQCKNNLPCADWFDVEAIACPYKENCGLDVSFTAEEQFSERYRMYGYIFSVLESYRADVLSKLNPYHASNVINIGILKGIDKQREEIILSYEHEFRVKQVEEIVIHYVYQYRSLTLKAKSAGTTWAEELTNHIVDTLYPLPFSREIPELPEELIKPLKLLCHVGMRFKQNIQDDGDVYFSNLTYDVAVLEFWKGILLTDNSSLTCDLINTVELPFSIHDNLLDPINEFSCAVKSMRDLWIDMASYDSDYDEMEHLNKIIYAWERVLPTEDGEFLQLNLFSNISFKII